MENQDLYIQIGRALMEDSLGASHFDDEELENIGRRWYSQKLQKLRKLICENENTIAYIQENKNNKRMQVVAALADLILGVVGVVPPTTVSLLIINQGLDELCSEVNNA